jgi:antitoxin FitA
MRSLDAAPHLHGSRENHFFAGPKKYAAFCVPLAGCPHCWHYDSVAVQINIRDVPEKVRDELAARAALQGKSMQEFLRSELERLAARPSIDAWLRQVRKRKRATQTRISPKQILGNRNADRR